MLVNNGLGPGGAERVIVTLANAWVRRGYEVFILTLDSTPAFYPLAAEVRRASLDLAGSSRGLFHGIRANVDRVKSLRQKIKEFCPDVVVGFMARTGIITVLSSLRLNVPTIICEHCDPAQIGLGVHWSMLRGLTYPMADAVTFLTENVVERWVPLLGSKAILLPNPVVTETPVSYQTKLFQHPRNLIAMGRMVPEKGFDLLLSAFSSIAAKNSDWGLTILGDGELRPQIEAMIEDLGLNGRVQLPGHVRNAFEWLRQADLFVMSSRFEGMPCSLCEAMACGLPAISFDCDSGPRDIVRDGLDGVLVAPLHVVELATAIDHLMSSPEKRASMARRAPEVMERFGLEKILKRWDRLFTEVGVNGCRKNDYRLDETPA